MRSSYRTRESVTGILFTTPALIILSLFVVIPVVYSLGLSFFSWDMMTPHARFVGFQNYQRLLSNNEFYSSVTRTLWYAVMTVPTSILLGMFFALLLDNRKSKLSVLYRVAFFTPLVTSTVAVSVVWMWIYDPEHGFLNEFLSWFGIPPQQWLSDPKMSLFALAIMAVWKNVGFSVILYYAGLQNMPANVLEAASVDGANDWQIVRRIKLPLLTPTTYLLLILLTIEQFQTFTQVNVMTQGGPANSTELVVVLLWHYAFEFFEMGYASAIAMAVFVMILILTLIQMFVVGRKVHYQ